MDDIVAKLLAQTAHALAGRRVPGATYRLQFHGGFTFRDAAAVAPYLHALGISHCHASPYLKARVESKHGYDITDHRLLNPEIGSEDDYDAWIDALRAHGLHHILDTVPNHMAVVGNDNQWWNDVLENGPASPYAEYFDIAWAASIRPELHGRVLVPILGEPYGKVIESQQLRLHYDAGAFTLHYFEHRFPIAPHSYSLILGERREELENRLSAATSALLEYQSILTSVKNLPLSTETDPARLAERTREKEVVKRRLAALTAAHAPVAEFIHETLALFNGQPGDPRSFDRLEQLLDQQAYRLASWRVAADEINYRRFFDVNELAALSMEREEVFAATHERIVRLLVEDKVAGLRIDHPDGLYDPAQYLRRLGEEFLMGKARAIFDTKPEYQGLDWQELAGPLRIAVANKLSSGLQKPAPQGQDAAPIAESCLNPIYVVVEKILTGDESLPDDWRTDGTTGYDFLNAVNGLFVDAGNAAAFTRLYRNWIQDDAPFAAIAYQKKILILQIALSSELQMLTRQLDRLAQQNRWSRDFTLQGMHRALREVIAAFPVYRTYVAAGAIHDSDRKHIVRAIHRARMRNPALSTDLFQFVRDMLLLKTSDSSPCDAAQQAQQHRFVGKFQQATAPVMAKGVEDTAFYVYNRLLSLNEVGGDPNRFGVAPDALHRTLQQRQARWAGAISATSTHDTKRSEDVRARINVLSEMPQEWAECLARWSRLNEPLRVALEDGPAPDANEECFIYQTLLGAWPLDPCPPPEYDRFVARMQAYLTKALQEAKVHTSWINPNSAYDNAVAEFLARILDPQTGRAFLKDFRPFQERISRLGMVNALAQTLLKITAPGVPEIYQGTELWVFSLVDPDNRRPVDYGVRMRQLHELQARSERLELAHELWRTWQDGRIKLYVTWRALDCRRANADVFMQGEYVPLEVKGARHEHVFGFVRRQGSQRALIAVPRLIAHMAACDDSKAGAAQVWQDTVLQLAPLAADRPWLNVLTGEWVQAGRDSAAPTMPVSALFANFPVALLVQAE